jgi:hypothetical protein
VLHEGAYASVSEMAAAKQIERDYPGTLLRLTLLAPKIVDGILNECAAADLTLPRLMAPFPTTWAEQRRALPTALSDGRRG